MTWQEIARISIRGRRLMIKDSMIQLSANEAEPEWPCIDIDPGDFIVEAKTNVESCETVRVLRDTASPSSRRKIGDVSIDHGSFGLIDYDTFLKAVSRDPDAYDEWTAMDLDDVVWDQMHGRLSFCDTFLVFGKAGEGDGVYDVFELTDGKEVVGLECTFVPAA